MWISPKFKLLLIKEFERLKAEEQKQKEEEEGKVSVRSRFLGDEGSKDLGEFIDAICKEIRTKEIRVELPEA